MYCAGKIITVVFSIFCICFTKDLQNVFLSFDGMRKEFILRNAAFNNRILLFMDLDSYGMANRTLNLSIHFVVSPNISSEN